MYARLRVCYRAFTTSWVWGAVALCVALLLAAVYLPGLSDVLQARDPGAEGWALLLGMSLVPLVVGQVVRLVQGARARGGG